MKQAAPGRNADLEGKRSAGLQSRHLRPIQAEGFNWIVRSLGNDQKTEVSEEKKEKWSFGMWLFMAVAGVFLVGITMPSVIRSEKKVSQTKAIGNSRQLGLALYEFQVEYGRFPDETTAPKVRVKTGMQLELGNSSANDYFQQLVAAEIVSSPYVFYAKSAFSAKAAAPAEHAKWAIEPGTVGFGYLMNGKSSLDEKGNPSRPLACAPLAFDGKSVSTQQFDPGPYDGKTVVLRIDNSVLSLPIQKDTSLAILGGGKTLLETGRDSIWSSKDHPVIIPPLPKR